MLKCVETFLVTRFGSRAQGMCSGKAECERRMGARGRSDGKACPPTPSINPGALDEIGHIAAALSLTPAAWVVRLPSFTRPPERGLRRLLQGSASPSVLVPSRAVLCAIGGGRALANARARTVGSLCGGNSPHSSSIKGMVLPAGKQLWNWARQGSSSTMSGGEVHPS